MYGNDWGQCFKICGRSLPLEEIHVLRGSRLSGGLTLSEKIPHQAAFFRKRGAVNYRDSTNTRG